jgi:putative hydroxymethylpyrimidine transporter CytX
VFSILNVLQLVGWTAVMVKSAAESLNMISKTLWSINNVVLWSIIIGALTALWIIFGMTGFKKINSIAVTLLFLLTVVLGWIIFRNGELFSVPSGEGMSFGGALELSIVMPLSWLPLIADYTRFAKSEKQGAWGSFLGYFFGSSWMFIIGLGAAIVSKDPDPSAMLLAANLGMSAFGIVILSTITTTFMDAYSAGVTFLNVVPKLSEKTTSVVMTVIGTAAALVFPIDSYTSFLYAIGSVFAPLFAVLLTDYFIIKKQTKIVDKLLLNVGATVIWAIGIALYYYFIKIDFILGATVPSMIITGLLYIVSWRYINKWKLEKKSQSSYAA